MMTPRGGVQSVQRFDRTPVRPPHTQNREIGRGVSISCDGRSTDNVGITGKERTDVPTKRSTKANDDRKPAQSEAGGDRVLRVEYRPLEYLIPYARNARTHSDAQVAQIAASIKEFGWTNPISGRRRQWRDCRAWEALGIAQTRDGGGAGHRTLPASPRPPSAPTSWPTISWR